MQKEFVGQRQFEKLPALPRRPKLTDMQQQAVDAYFELQAVQNVPHMATSASVGTIADAYISRAQAGGGRAKELQQKVDPFKKDPEYQAAITFETEVRKRAKEALQLERQAYEDGLVFLQIGASQGLGGQQSAIQKDIASDLRAWTDRRKALLSEPAVFDRYRIEQLILYKTQLNSPDHFVELPSRLEFEREIISLWLNGQSVMVSGYTGTGKSEIVKQAALRISKLEKGQATYPIEIKGNNQTLLQDFFGDIGLSNGNTTFVQGAAARALSHRLPDGSYEGDVVQLEESNLLPNQTHLTVRDILNKSAGQEISLPDPTSDKKVIRAKVGKGYHYAATQNPKGEKYDREETWAEVDRAYGHPRNNLYYMQPVEVYDLALSAMMDEIGGIPLSQQDLLGTRQADGSYNGTLVRLLNLAQEFQNAYTGLAKASDGGLINSSEELNKLIVDPAKVVAIVRGFANRHNQSESFNTYISNRFLAEFINNPTYPVKDRLYILSRMVAMQFFRGFKVSDFEITGEGITRSQIDQALSGQIRARDTYDNGYTYPEVVAKLDPYGHLAQLRTRLNLTSYVTDDIARQRPNRQSIDMRGIMGLSGLTPEQVTPSSGKQPKTPAAILAAVGSGINLKELQKDSGKVRRRMIMTKVIRNLPPPLSYPFSYGRDAIIIPGPSVMIDGDGGRVVWSIFTSPVNGIPRVSAWRHRRGFKKALDKRQQLMMDVLQKHQGAYSVDTWNSMAKSFNDLTTLSNQSGRQRLDNYWDDYGFEAEWQWTPDATLVSMLANRFPKLQTREEINTIWRTVFETRSLLRRQDIGQKEFKTKLTNELCNVLLNSKDTNAVSQARKYLTVLLTRNNSGTTELALYATAQNAAAVRSKLTT